MSDESRTNVDYARRHLQFGWWSLLTFTVLGLLLEYFHGFKVRAYLDVSNDTRRLMWTLAHAHGTLLSLVNLIFGVTVRVMPEMSAGNRRSISMALVGATILLPLGFFLGGIAFYSGDPGVGVLLVPIGAILLLVAVFQLALGAGSAGAPDTKGQRRTR